MNIFSQTAVKLRRGFTIAEVLIVVGLIGLVVSVSMPMYNRYIARNSMEIARQNVAQGLERAKFLAQTGMNDSAWGFSTIAIPGRGVLFMGDSFATRNPAFDELYSIPESITVDGLTEVVFEKVTGLPSVTGTITITTEYNEETSITVNLGEQGEVDIPQDWMEICVNPYTAPETIRVPDSLWIVKQEEGALIGNCNSVVNSSGGSSTSSSTSSSSTSGGSSTSSSSTSSVTVGDDSGPVEEDVEIDEDGTVVINDNVKFTAKIVCTELRISSGYDAPITARFKLGSGPFIEPWGDYTKPVDGNINKTGKADFTSDTIVAVDSLDIWARSYYKKKSWYDGSQNTHFNMNQQVWTPHESILVSTLKNGDEVPNYEGAGGQPSVEECLTDYVNTNPSTGDKTMSLAGNQIMYLFELWTSDVTSPSADFQDLVMLVTFNGI
jgi:Tfp pilus assembly protein FimT